MLTALFPGASPESLALLHATIRKLAHVFEYFIFSLLVLRGLRDGRPGWQVAWGARAVLLCAAYAALDELHQAYVPPRVASAADVALDTLGAATAQFLAWLRARRM